MLNTIDEPQSSAKFHSHFWNGMFVILAGKYQQRISLPYRILS